MVVLGLIPYLRQPDVVCGVCEKKLVAVFKSGQNVWWTEKMSHLNRKRAFNFAPNELPDKKNGATKKTAG